VAEVRIGDRVIGETHPVYIIAEAGNNHNGRLDIARRLIEVAAEAGADAVKFQVYRAGEVYPRSAGVSSYLKREESVFDLIADLEMPWEWLPALADHCSKCSVAFLASVFGEESADRVDPFVQAFKVASYEMSHVPLIDHLLKKGKPLIVSTGASELEEVREMVDRVESRRNSGLALMQCTAAYPAPLESLNLRAMATMKQNFGTPVGLSDHSRHPLVGPMVAAAMGADLIEKHFTLSNRLPGPDHSFAVEPDELASLVHHVRAVEAAAGRPEKIVDPVEAELRRFARRSIFTTRRIAMGELLTRDNVAVLRCGQLDAGLPPSDLPRILGRRTSMTLEAEQPLCDEHVE
jgi:sialic acid synthase SpsE